MPIKIFHEFVHRSYKNFATKILWWELSGLRFAYRFAYDIPDLQRHGGVRPSRFWTSFLTNISFQFGHSSTASDLTSI